MGLWHYFWAKPNIINNDLKASSKINPTLQRSCHFTNLAQIREMDIVSKPRLPIEIYTFREIMSTDEFRRVQKKSMTIRWIDRANLRTFPKFPRLKYIQTPNDSWSKSTPSEKILQPMISRRTVRPFTPKCFPDGQLVGSYGLGRQIIFEVV